MLAFPLEVGKGDPTENPPENPPGQKCQYPFSIYIHLDLIPVSGNNPASKEAISNRSKEKKVKRKS